MKNTTSRILIETVVRKTLKNIKDSPERSIRNLIDMALNFSNGRFQYEFFKIAKTMLKNENSPYYDLIKDIAANSDSERILKFGMNIGYNSCTLGAKKIRETEIEEGYNIPWTVYLTINSKMKLKELKRINQIMSQGETLGIYTWMIFCEKGSESVMALAKRHPESAIILFCDARQADDSFCGSVSNLKNIMPVIKNNEYVSDMCGKLRDMQIPFSIYDFYTDENVEYITSGDIFSDTEQLHPVLTAVIPDKNCSDETISRVGESVKKVRDEQLYQTIAWDALNDTDRIDCIISDDSCMVAFDENGELLDKYKREENEASCRSNIFKQDLTDILKENFPKGGTIII